MAFLCVHDPREGATGGSVSVTRVVEARNYHLVRFVEERTGIMHLESTTLSCCSWYTKPGINDSNSSE